MEVLDSMIMKSSTFGYTQIPKLSSTKSNTWNSQLSFKGENRIPSYRKLGLKSGFDDEGHLEYYSRVSPVCCGKGKGKGKKGWNGIPAKKRVKLLKGLVEDLSTFSELGFGCDDNQGFVADDDNNSVIISQAAETLLTRLKQLRAEEEEQMKCNAKDCESSSSSSSESSDSECDEVVDMKSVKNKMAIVKPIDAKDIHPVDVTPASTMLGTLKEQPTSERLSQSAEQKCSNMILDVALSKESGIEALDVKTPSLYQLTTGSTGKKIEVCMGGKCKKLGAPALMEEFQRVMGDQGAVEGCKCMGKCKSAPNVRAVKDNVGDNSLMAPSKALCIGVGLEDVELIVANHLGIESSKRQLCVAVAQS